MSREIKFRAWDKKSKKIREIDCIAFHNKRGAFDFDSSNTPKVINVWGRDMIEDKDCILHREENDVILMQFTGLTDKNGINIYEEDILKASESIVKIVFSGRGYEGIYLNKEEKHEPPIQNNNYLQWEVIGNSFESPELLTQ